MMKYLLSLILLFTSLIHAINWSHVIEHKEEYSLVPIFGGASNNNFCITVEGTHYFLRFGPGCAKTLYADLSIEYEALAALAKLGVSPKPIFCDQEKNVLVTEHLSLDQADLSLEDSAIRKETFVLLHTIEESGLKISRQFEPYAQTKALADIAATLPSYFYAECLPLLQQIDRALLFNPKKTLCHLDLHSGNVLQGEGRLWLVDWEYAMMSHPLLVLASMASIEHWDDDTMETILYEYLDAPTEKEFYTLYLYRIAIDLFWTAWNHIQSKNSTLNQPYAVWEGLFYASALDRLASPTFEKALQGVKVAE